MAVKKEKFKDKLGKVIREQFADGALFCTTDLHPIATANGLNTQALQYAFNKLQRDGVIVKTIERRKIRAKWAALYQLRSIGTSRPTPAKEKAPAPEDRIAVMMRCADRLAKAFGMPIQVAA